MQGLGHTVIQSPIEHLKTVREGIIYCVLVRQSQYVYIGPAAAPQNVMTMAESSTEITVTWEEVPAIDENGNITMYEVEYMPLETFDGQIATNSVTVDPTLLNTTLTGLEEYVDYNISVRAFTSVGPGPYSVSTVERTDQDGI